MVQFNELTISPDGKHLVIDVSVKDEPYYKNVYIDSILIDNADTYVESSVSSTPVYEYTLDSSKKRKSFRLDLTPLDLVSGNLEGLLFVYVRTKGTPTADTPCGKDNITTMGTVVNLYPLYTKGMNYIKELASTCQVPQNFTKFLLEMKALELAVRTGHYVQAINYYNRFFSNMTIISNTCGCHGQ